jgi:hypothetical protein
VLPLGKHFSSDPSSMGSRSNQAGKLINAYDTSVGPWIFLLRMRSSISHLTANAKVATVLRPYLINFDATGSPCHELTSWDNSSSMSI